MTKKQAELILNTGKYINFLSDFCQERMSLSGSRQKLRNLEQKRGIYYYIMLSLLSYI